MALVVSVLVVANWSTVREHVVAWWFQATRETETVVPSPALMKAPGFEHFAAGETIIPSPT